MTTHMILQFMNKILNHCVILILVKFYYISQTRIQDSEGGVGGSYIQKGGGFVQEFQEQIQIVAGSWANQQAKKNCRQP